MEPKTTQLLKKYMKSYMRDEKLQLEAHEVQELMISINSLIKSDIAEANLSVYKELTELIDVIKVFKSEIRDIFTEGDKPTSTDELDVVLQTTEDAVEQILICAETIDQLVPEAPEALGAALTDISTRIYEASNFQDINGQRIKKVIKTFRVVEEKSQGILASTGIQAMPSGESVSGTKDQSSNENLLNGPANPDEAPSQEEIDKLLSQI